MKVVRLSSMAALVILGVAVARPRPCAAQMQYSAPARNVTLRVTIPEGLTKIRGVLAFTVRGIASGWATSDGYKELAKRLDAVIVTVSGGDDLNDNSYPNRCASGEFNGLGEALAKLAEASKHPELANAPVVGIGHSHGGDWWNWYNACHPERMAMVFVHASGGVNYSGAALRTPVVYELGTGDLIENGSKKPRAGMFANRGKGAPMSLVIGQGEGHNNVTAASMAMVIDIIEATFKLRVPADADGALGPVKLNEIREGAGTWLGDLYTKEIAPYAAFTGNKALTSFLPNEEVAKKWKETGPGLPTSIMLPTGTCGWCGNPKDEPKAAPSMDPPATAADAGTSTGTPDAAPAVVMNTPDGGAAPAVKKDASPVADPPQGGDEVDVGTGPAPRSGGGCSVGARPDAGVAMLVLLAAAGGRWLRRRSRGRAR